MKNSVLVTITGLAHYYGTKPFKVGAVIKLKKEYDNKYDDEVFLFCNLYLRIRVFLQHFAVILVDHLNIISLIEQVRKAGCRKKNIQIRSVSLFI